MYSEEQTKHSCENRAIFTVARVVLRSTKLSVSELHRFSHTARGLYRRSGITPCPEDMLICCHHDTTAGHSCQGRLAVVECYCPWGTVGSVSTGVVSTGFSVDVRCKPRITPFAEVSVMSPPMIWFLYTSKVA